MKFTSSLLALAFLAANNLSLVSGAAVLNAPADIDIRAENITEIDDPAFVRRSDGEWEWVIFDGAKKGEQCGGTELASSSGTGSAACHKASGESSICAELNVGANLGFASCTFRFTKKSCADSGKSVEVSKGSSKVETLPAVQFVSVSCKK
ncbi:hypothetical protein LZL87_013163 [Fusarium oxysporum]|nr:hypothetical protein LZL87_013163 [Fusarium oxysporum]